MKIEKIDRKEKDSPVLQGLIVLLTLVEVVLMSKITLAVINNPSSAVIGKLLAMALIVLAVLFWALEKGYLAYERVYAIE